MKSLPFYLRLAGCINLFALILTFAILIFLGLYFQSNDFDLLVLVAFGLGWVGVMSLGAGAAIGATLAYLACTVDPPSELLYGWAAFFFIIPLPLPVILLAINVIF